MVNDLTLPYMPYVIYNPCNQSDQHVVVKFEMHRVKKGMPYGKVYLYLLYLQHNTLHNY